MKWLDQLERKWFPNESYYQRTRRRYVVLFYFLTFLVIFAGAFAVLRHNAAATDIGGEKVRARALPQ